MLIVAFAGSPAQALLAQILGNLQSLAGRAAMEEEAILLLEPD
jgi:hypothetical protein